MIRYPEKKAAEETAESTYFARLKEVRGFMKELDDKIKDHYEQFKKDRTNWGFAGDMENVAEGLKDIVDFLW